MKTLSSLLLALLAVGIASPLWATEGSPYRTMKLPNGLEVIVIEDHSVPLATISIAVRTGSFTEPDELAGLSHLYEHMFFKANKVLPSQEQYMKRVRQLGVDFNGYTTDEVVVYHFTLPSKNTDPGMKFMADAIQFPLFNQEELVKEREVVLGEFDRNEARPNFVLGYAIDSALWMPHVSRKQPLGQRMIIKTATEEKMQMIKERFYVPNNAALIVSGDVKPEEIFALAKKYLSEWKRGADPFPTYTPPQYAPLKSKLIVREAKLPEVTSSMHFYGPSIGKEDKDVHIAQYVMTMLRMPTARIYQNLVDSGLATSYGAWAGNSRNTSELVFSLNGPKEKIKQAVEVLKNEIRAMAQPGYFSEDELEAAKQVIATRSTFERDNLMSFNTNTTARWWSLHSLDYYLNFPREVQRITPDDVSAFVNKYLVGKQFVMGVGAERATLDQLNFTEEVLKW